MIKIDSKAYEVEQVEVDKVEKKIYLILESSTAVTIDYATLSLINSKVKEAYNYKIEL
jgi:hypothetical protein